MAPTGGERAEALSLDAFEDFGQKVSLCARIREILINYPEGTSVLKEIVQNADDAGARTVAFCLDFRQHGTAALVYQGLAPFQGPALLAYNDAVFSERDFESISRVGDSVKRDAEGKTGRFGVGFNSCYHVTDLPSFVSGRHLVMFDPHCQHLPAISASNPGKKLDFVTHPIADRFPDSAAPYCALGCDMRSEFKGTLFRFPMRSPDMAAGSQISRQSYPPDAVAGWLATLKEEAMRVMLFLKHVERLQILEWHQGQASPTPLFTCELASTPPELLTARGAFLRVARAAASSGADLQRMQQAGPSVHTVVFRNTDEVSGRSWDRPFLVAQSCGTRTAAELAANATQRFGVRVVPWGSVAAPLALPTDGSGGSGGGSGGDGSGLAREEGYAFCFLPLPLRTGLPFHVNAFFELSTNRRDVWYGSDMAGLGALRSDWNACLLREVAGPCYAALLAAAASRLVSPCDAYSALWPADLKTARQPWAMVLDSMCSAAANLRVVGTVVRSGDLQWVTPKEAVYPDEQAGADELLMSALSTLRVPASALPHAANALLLRHFEAKGGGGGGGEGGPRRLHPDLVRRWLLERPGCGAGLGAATAVAVLGYCMQDVVDDDVGSVMQLAGLPLLPLRDGSVVLLDAWAGESRGGGAAQGGGGRYITDGPGQEALLSGAPQLVADMQALGPELSARLCTVANLRCLSLLRLTPADLGRDLLPALLPANWQGAASVPAPWALGSVGSSGGGGGGGGLPTERWVQLLWKELLRFDDLSPLASWPLLATQGGLLLRMDPLDRCSLLAPSGLPPEVLAAAQKLGCHVVDPGVVPPSHPALRLYAHPSDGRGVLAALGNAARQGQQAGGQRQQQQASAQLTVNERRALRSYLAREQWLEPQRGSSSSSAAASSAAAVLRALPIFESAAVAASTPEAGSVHGQEPRDGGGGAAEGGGGAVEGRAAEPVFIDLVGERYVAPGGAPAEVMSREFVAVDGPTQSAVLTKQLGVRQLTQAEFYRAQVLPKLASLPGPLRERIAVHSLLPQLPQLAAEDPGLPRALAALPFVSTRSGRLAAPNQLYDPRVSELISLLDPDTAFPSGAFAASGATLSALCQMGLRTAASPDTLLQAAEYIQSLDAAGGDAAVAYARGKSLLAYLELEAGRLFRGKGGASAGGGSAAKGGGGAPVDMFLSRITRMASVLKSKPKSADSLGPNTVPSSAPQPAPAGSASATGEDEAAVQFWQRLSELRWCPVLVQAPIAGLPYSSGGDRVASPRDTRPLEDMWLCSAQRRVLDGECRSAVLAAGLGWAQPLPGQVVAAQLRELGAMHEHIGGSGGGPEGVGGGGSDAAEGDALRQLLSGVVPQLYSSLAGLAPEELRAAADTAALADAPCVWIGNGFARPSVVAFSGPLNLAPHLYVLPGELAPFRELLLALGCAQSFGASQYISVLRDMASSSAGRPLPGGRLAEALSMVGQLADLGPPAGLGEVPVPDSRAVLRDASCLVYNDAPWLDNEEQQSGGAAAGGGLPGAQVVHPNISHDVADRLGVASLRRRLLAASADLVALGLAGPLAGGGLGGGGGGVQAFGQSEALTTRLRHIIDSYADGPGVLMELVQNADDAGATRVAFLLDQASFPANSILGPSMQAFQGPALLSWNDALFSPSDFSNISRIGQDSKASKPGATGRFGLGFNAVYHLTDLPSFVSGDYLVQFDPHAKYLPGISPAQPGLRVAFQRAALLQQFPDAFAPYLHFGCTLRESYQGTLFRFPLRTAEIAPASDIKPQPYPPSAVLDLFSKFERQLVDCLLFLKSVRSVELYVRSGGPEDAPQLLCSCSAAPENGLEPQRVVADFVRGGGGGKDEFRRRLAATPAAKLPNCCAPMRFTTRKPKEAPATAAVADPAGRGQGGGGGGGGWDGGASQSLVEEQERWMVCSELAGGRALEMALTTQLEGRGLMPWVGVACRLPPTVPAAAAGGGGGREGGEAGRAFCFLPLPVQTRLPVNVHGYFELSSNRREIWYGTDMSGAGRLRSEWNLALLRDACAPAYLRLLAHAAKELGPGPKYEAMWPTGQQPPEPWGTAVRSLYERAGDLPLVWTAAGGGRWVTPREAVFVDAGVAAAAASSGSMAAAAAAAVAAVEEEEEQRQVVPLLVRDGLTVAALPAALAGQFLRLTPGVRALTPALVRRHFARKGATHPLLDLGDDGDDAERASSVSAVLSYCLSDVDPTDAQACCAELAGLITLPLPGAALGELRPSSDAAAPRYFLPVDQAQRSVLQGTALEQRLVDVDPVGCSRLWGRLAAVAATGALNLSLVDARQLGGSILPALLPREWRGKAVVEWHPGERGHPTREWLAALWKVLGSFPDLRPLEGWHVVPLAKPEADGKAGGGTMQLCQLMPESQVLIPGGWTESVDAALSTLGCLMWDVGVVQPTHPGLLDGGYVQPPTCSGVLRAVKGVGAQGDAADGGGGSGAAGAGAAWLTVQQREDLRAFMMQTRWFTASVDDVPGPEELSTLQGLPIFRCPAAALPAASLPADTRAPAPHEGGTDTDGEIPGGPGLPTCLEADAGALVTGYAPLLLPRSSSSSSGGGAAALAASAPSPPSQAARLRSVAPDGVDASLLTPDYVQAGSDVERRLLAGALGCRAPSLQAFLASDLPPLLPALRPAARDNLLLGLLRVLPPLVGTQPELRSQLAGAAFVPTPSGPLRCPGELYDPRDRQLGMLLDPGTCFPCEALARDEQALDALRLLGLRSGVSREVLLEAARSLEAAAAAASAAGRGGSGAGAGTTSPSGTAGMGGGGGDDLSADLGPARRAKALLAQMDALAQREGTADPEARSFWATVSLVSCLPVLTHAPHRGLPWPPAATPLAAPRTVRCLEDCWVFSASMRILDGRCGEDLKAALGWDYWEGDPPPANVLAAQLLELGKMHRHRGTAAGGVGGGGALGGGATAADGAAPLRQHQGQRGGGGGLSGAVVSAEEDDEDKEELAECLAMAADRLYGLMAHWVHGAGPEADVMRVMLEGAPCVWVGDGFRPAALVVAHSPGDLRPYLWSVPLDLSRHHSVLSWLGVADHFSAQHYARGLQQVAQQAGGRPLDEDTRQMAVQMAVGLGALLDQGAVQPEGEAATAAADSCPPPPSSSLSDVGSVYLPDALGCMAPAAALFFNDAAWLTDTGLRMAHPDIPAHVAEALGCQSVRYHASVSETLTQDLPCPPAGLLSQLLEAQQDGRLAALMDLAELADAAGAQTMEVYLDLSQHGSTQLLHPGLAPLQGPALCVRLPGVTLTTDELCMLQTPPSPYSLRGRVCTYGTGLLASYMLTDVPMTISGSNLVLWDPCGSYLAESARDAGRPLAKQYSLAPGSSDLASRFKDQFSVWDFAGGLEASAAGQGGGGGGGAGASLLLRLPLRPAAAAQAPSPTAAAGGGYQQGAVPQRNVCGTPCSEDEARDLVRAFAGVAGRAMLFMRSMRQVRCLEWRRGTGPPRVLGQSSLMPHGASHGAVARAYIESREWRPSASRGGSLLALGRKLVSSAGGGRGDGARRVVPCELIVTTEDGDTSQESWVVAACAGAGPARDLALDRQHQQLLLDPWAAVAVRVTDPNQQQQQQQQHGKAKASNTAGGPSSGGRSGTGGSGAAVQPSSGLFCPLPLLAGVTARCPADTSGRYEDAAMLPPGPAPAWDGGLSGLPFLVAGNFCLGRNGGRHLLLDQQQQPASPDAIRSAFNRALLHCLVAAWVDCLKRLRDVDALKQYDHGYGAATGLGGGTSLGGLYNMVPMGILPPLAAAATTAAPPAAAAHSGGTPPQPPGAPPPDGQQPGVVMSCLRDELTRRVCRQAAQHRLWRLRSGRWVHLRDGCFLQQTPIGAGPLALEFITQQLPVFDVPHGVRLMLAQAGVEDVKEVTPATVRPMLKRLAKSRDGGSINPHEAVQLLAFCMGDVLKQTDGMSGAGGGAAGAADIGLAGLVHGLGIPGSVVNAAATNMQGLLSNADGWMQRMLGAAADGAGGGAAGAAGAMHGGAHGSGASTSGSGGGAAGGVWAPGSGLAGLGEHYLGRLAAAAAAAGGAGVAGLGAAAGTGAGGAAVPPPPDPLDRAAAQDCVGLPVPTASGRIVTLGSRKLSTWPAGLEHDPPSALVPPQGGVSGISGSTAATQGTADAALGVWDSFFSPLGVAALGPYLEVPQLRAALQLPRYGLGDVPAHLECLLPAGWAPPRTSGLLGRGRSAPLYVEWDWGRKGGPGPEWLQTLWQMLLGIAAAERPAAGLPAVQPEQWDQLSSWPLLPTTKGRLFGVHVRHLVMPPPPAESQEQQPRTPDKKGKGSASGAAADGGGGHFPVPGASEAPAAAGVWQLEGGGPVTWAWLQPWLDKVGAPVLDPRFAPCTPVVLPSPGGSGGAGRLQDVLVAKLRAGAEHGLVQFGELSEQERRAMFEWLASGAPSLSDPADRFFLQQLPLFPALDGSLVALSALAAMHPAAAAAGGTPPLATCDASAIDFTVGGVDALPQGLRPRLLEYRPEWLLLYSRLQVPILSEHELLERLLLPAFPDLSPTALASLLGYLATHASQMRGNRPLLSALAGTPFVDAGAPDGTRARPRELYDPEHPLLPRVFKGRAVFPVGEFAGPRWLPLLREAGLRKDIDAQTFKECAEALASRSGELPHQPVGSRAAPSSSTAGEELWGTALLLAKHLADNCAALHAAGLAPMLRGIAFAPATRGVPGSSTARRVLAPLDGALHPRDWRLAWAAAPVLEEAALPPQSMWTALGLRSPPVFDTIAEHLHQVGADGGDSALSSWPHHQYQQGAGSGGLEEDFRSPLAHLQEQGLSEAQAARLRGAACVPVANGTLLVEPSRLFVRLRRDLSPLAWEVPPAFAPVSDLLCQLGAHAAPEAEQLLRMLSQLATRVGPGAALGVNELRSVSSLLSYLTDDEQHAARWRPAVRAAHEAGQLLVPTVDARLVPSRNCCCAAQCSGRLLARLDPSAVMLAHPLLPAALCSSLGMPSLNRLVVEVLDTSAPLRQLERIQGVSLAQVQGVLCGAPFRSALRSALWEASPALPAELRDAHRDVPPAALQDVASRLRFVAECRTRLELRQESCSGSSGSGTSRHSASAATSASGYAALNGDGISGGGGGTNGGGGSLIGGGRDVTRGGRASKVYEFVDGGSGAVFVSDPPMHVPLASLLSRAVCRALGLPLTLPLDAFFSCPPSAEALGAVQSALTWHEDAADTASGTASAVSQLARAEAAGKLGCPMVPSDMALLQLRPLRPYVAGEVVAYRGKVPPAEAAALAAEARHRQQQQQQQRRQDVAAAAAASEAAGLPSWVAGAPLLYGRVARDCRPPAGAPLYRVPVEVGGGAVLDVLSSELLAFRPAFAAAAAAAASPSASAHGPQEGAAVDVGSSSGPATAAAEALPSPPPPSSTGEAQGGAAGGSSPADGLVGLRTTPRAATGEVVAAGDVLTAVREMLGAAGLSLEDDAGGLMERVLGLQQRLSTAEERAGRLEREASAAREEADSSRGSWTCRICLQAEVDAAMATCGHVLCASCAGSVRGRCPFCRTPSSVTRLYN